MRRTMEKIKERKAITLIALVVTIVVLLMLAGVSISLIVDNNGIIKRSKDAKKQYGEAQANEQEQMGDIPDWVEEATAEPIPKIDVNTKATDNSTINGKKGKAYNPTIPKGYTPIDTETSSWGDGSSAPTQNDVDNGLVIRDDSDNEWVWIPVPNVTAMCDTANKIEYNLLETEETAIKTKLYSRTITIGKNKDTAFERTTPGITTGCREPDLINSDLLEKFYKDVLGFSSVENEKKAFVNDYKEMIESITKYGGFYIGRYELSETGVKQNQPTLRGKNWYEFYQKCKMLNASEKVETRMIWGIQWDITCDFINNKGEKKNIEDSTSWGNYINSVNPANTGNYKSKERQNTGSNENWKANNIYDLAGNCSEWTQEAINNNGRCYRGGYYELDGANCGVWKSVGDIWPYYTDYVDNFLRYASHSNNKSNLKKENIKIL